MVLQKSAAPASLVLTAEDHGSEIWNALLCRIVRALEPLELDFARDRGGGSRGIQNQCFLKLPVLSSAIRPFTEMGSPHRGSIL